MEVSLSNFKKAQEKHTNFLFKHINDFISDKLMKIIDEKIFILDSGRLFTRNISMRFDPLVSKKIGTYSRTI